MIAIVDYGAGNLESVVRAFTRLGEEARITQSPEEVAAADRIVLPGVGFFDKAIQFLHARGLAAVLERRALGERVPLLGICLGFQMLCAHSEEGDAAGLGWLDAQVRRLPGNGLKVPHIGWNDPAWAPGHPWAEGLKPGACFYFAHSYYVDAGDADTVAATCAYGVPFAAAAQRGNLFGVQFHPEKSHENGLRLLQNFLEISARA